MKIKTFPLQFVDEYLDRVRKAAAYLDMSMKEFMLDAIAEKLEKTDRMMKGEM